ncbi:MAG TPA: 6-bladed beta-propeller [Longimicrobiaceae bacterium]|nr:6-bladed beta-propeller [Longimicrobiaceae bacterium]
MTRFAPLCVLWSALACAQEAQPPLPHGPTWEYRERFRVGSVDDPEYGLSLVAAVEFDDEGHVYVLQPLEHRVRIYDDDGTFIRSIGGPGAGPGEFRNPVGLIRKADTLVVVDSGNRRLSYFANVGRTFVRSEPSMEPGASGLALRPTALLPDGSAVASVLPTGAGIRAGAQPPTVRVAKAGGRVDTLGFDDSLGRAVQVELDGRLICCFRHPLPGGRSFLVMRDGSGFVTIEAYPATDAESASFRITR